MNTEFDITIYDRAIPENTKIEMFNILFDNMSQISTVGGIYEEDVNLWLNNAATYIENVAVASLDNRVVGYFQYRINDHTFYMDEFQIKREYQGSGLFRQVMSAVVETVPIWIDKTEACVEKGNIKSQKVLNVLGLSNAGETKNGICYVYRGRYSNIEKYISSIDKR